MFPAEWRDVLEESGIDGLRLSECLDCTFAIDGIPERDGGCDQIESAGPMTLILKGSVGCKPRDVLRVNLFRNYLVLDGAGIVFSGGLSLAKIPADIGPASCIFSGLRTSCISLGHRSSEEV